MRYRARREDHGGGREGRKSEGGRERERERGRGKKEEREKGRELRGRKRERGREEIVLTLLALFYCYSSETNSSHCISITRLVLVTQVLNLLHNKVI